MTTATLSRTPIPTRHGDDNDVDAIFAELAARAVGDERAADELRQLLLPSCRGIAGHLGDSVVAEVVAAAFAEVMDWARAEGHLTAAA